MILENVKVGDRVWVGGRRFLVTITRVTQTRFYGSKATQAWHKTGKPLNSWVAFGATGVATAEEVEAWEAEQAAKKAAAEAAERDREKAREEKRARLDRLIKYLGIQSDRIAFEGHKFEVREVE